MKLGHNVDHPHPHQPPNARFSNSLGFLDLRVGSPGPPAPGPSAAARERAQCQTKRTRSQKVAGWCRKLLVFRDVEPLGYLMACLFHGDIVGYGTLSLTEV